MQLIELKCIPITLKVNEKRKKLAQMELASAQCHFFNFFIQDFLDRAGII